MSRTDAFIFVACDRCGQMVEVQCTALAGGAWDERNVDAELRRMGWDTVDGDLCETCSERPEEDEA